MVSKCRMIITLHAPVYDIFVSLLLLVSSQNGLHTAPHIKSKHAQREWTWMLEATFKKRIKIFDVNFRLLFSITVCMIQIHFQRWTFNSHIFFTSCAETGGPINWCNGAFVIKGIAESKPIKEMPSDGEQRVCKFAAIYRGSGEFGGKTWRPNFCHFY